MKTLIQILILAAIALVAYLHYVPGARIEKLTDKIPFLQRIDPATGKPYKDCPKCKGVGQVNCSNARCKEGKVECDGPCIRLTKGFWIKNESFGHGPDELWINVGGGQYYTKSHVGEVFEYKNGKYVSAGYCKICSGTTLMACKVCKGTAKVICPFCKGKKEVPDMQAKTTKKTALRPTPNRTEQGRRLRSESV